ncbi:hypothetical protein GGU11DRAFT_425852 [Lentinula aff. detonsa]|nr:hypothetical protein GGU11DRAFT_425852 [Lentinula aff. detonsa]
MIVAFSFTMSASGHAWTWLWPFNRDIPFDFEYLIYDALPCPACISSLFGTYESVNFNVENSYFDPLLTSRGIRCGRKSDTAHCFHVVRHVQANGRVQVNGRVQSGSRDLSM